MTLTPDPPMTRRAAREARLAATGEVPPTPTASAGAAPAAFGSGPFTAGPFVPHVVSMPPSGRTEPSTTESTEPPTTTGIIGPDGLPMSRRRLRELRQAGMLDIGDTGDTGGGMTEPPAPEPTAPPAESTTPPAPEATAPPAQESASALVPAPPLTEAAPAPDVETTTPPRSTTIPPATTLPHPTSPAATPPAPAWTAPEGHWTRQLEDDDSAELTGSREVGGSPQTASSTLVVDHPAVMDLGGPLDATGEVLLTGSIPLSPDFARTGATGALGGAELDDRFDREFAAAPDAQPVRASAIASQHALGSPIVANAARRGGRGMTVLLVTASVLAVLVTGLVVTAIVLGWFGR